MPGSEPSVERSKIFGRYADQITIIMAAILVAGAIVFPRAMPFIYFALVLIALVELWRTGHLPDLLDKPDHFWIFAALFTTWCLITVLWSVVPLAALGKVVFLATTFIAAWIITCWTSTLSQPMSFQLKLGLFAGFMVGAIFLALEIGFDQPIKKALVLNFEFLRPGSTKHIIIENGRVVAMGKYLLNRSVAVLNLLFWPAVLLALNLFKASLRLITVMAIIVLVAIATFGSVHETSMIAFILGTLVFASTYILPRVGRISVTLAWILAIALVIPAINVAYNAKWYNADWLPDTAQARIVFWGYTASQYVKNPILGVGVRSTKFVDDATRKAAVHPAGLPYGLRTGRHGHNIYLQTWYELGAVGAVILALTGLAFLSRVNSLAASVKAYGFATFSVAAVLAAFTWGMWQVWYIAMFAMGAAVMLIAGHQDGADE